MRRRLLLTTDAIGGVWTYSLDLARALAEAEDMVVLLAVLGPAPDNAQLTEAAAVPGLQLIATDLPLDWLANNGEEVRNAAWTLASLAAECGADFVQLHTPALALCPYPVPVISVVHSCVATWWQAVRGEALPADLAWRAGLVREGLHRSDLVAAPTRAFARAIRATYDLPHLPRTVHNGRAAPASAGAERAGERAVLTAGRLWDAGKNVGTFDRAAAQSSLPFRAAGPLVGPNGEAVTLSHAEPLGSVPAEALAQALAARPIFVSTALYEPFGLAVLEAAQSGCALVLADRPGFRELWNEAALFVDPLDEHQVAAAIDSLAADGERRAALGRAAQERASAFTPAATAEAMLGLYASLSPSLRKVAA